MSPTPSPAPSPAAPDLLVVGGGPAGLRSALAAARCGAQVMLVDEAAELGGQIHRAPAPGLGLPLPADDTGERLRREIAASPRVEVRRRCSVFGVFEGGEVALEWEGVASSLRPRAIVLAPGAHEYVPPFPGWTLPGVITPGAAQVLAKVQGLAPGRRALVAGSGPFLLVVARQLHAAGVEVVAVLEAAPRRDWWRAPLAGWRSPAVLAEGIGHLAALRRAGIPLRYGRVPLRAQGEERLERVVHAPCDRGWHRAPGPEESVAVDTLCVGFGFVPRVQLAQSLGCALDWRPGLGGWVPRCDADGRSSVAGIYAAGDGSGVAGALVAELEGERCGLAAAVDLGLADPADLAGERRRIERRLARLAPLRAALDALSLPRPGLGALPDDDTEVCRCEEVTLRELREAVDCGATTCPSLKVATRIGMGPCQGLFCWPAAARAVAEQRGCRVEDVGPASPRPPLRPITLGALADAAR